MAYFISIIFSIFIISSVGYGGTLYGFLNPHHVYEKSLTENAFHEMAYSNPIYDHVGRLFFKESSVSSDLIGYASAIYIGDGMCLTAAHNCVDENLYYYIQFEIDGQKTEDYAVKKFIVHPLYKHASEYDIGLLVLEKKVDDLLGIEPCYDDPLSMTLDLIHVGYGKELTFTSAIFSPYKIIKRACVSLGVYLKKDKNKNGVSSLYSLPYKKDIVQNDRRLEFYEGIASFGMSGGGAFNPVHGLIGINTFFEISSIKSQKNEGIYTRCINFCVEGLLCVMNYFFQGSNHSSRYLWVCSVLWMKEFVCVQNVTTPLFQFKDWIEGMRLENQWGREEV